MTEHSLIGCLENGVHNSLAELTFRVTPGASGSIAIDLVQAQLNDTRLTLNPAQKLGADPTDGAIRVNLPASLDTAAAAEPPPAPAP